MSSEYDTISSLKIAKLVRDELEGDREERKARRHEMFEGDKHIEPEGGGKHWQQEDRGDAQRRCPDGNIAGT